MEAVISEKEPHTTTMRPVDLHLPRTKLVCLENTTNRGSGKVWPLEKIAEVEKVARSKNLKMHLDGARIWNAATNLKVQESDIADVVVKEQLVNQRLIPNSMEPRGAIAEYKSATEEFTVWLTSQAPHVHRLLATAFVFGIPETKMRVIAPHVGGGFGCKIFLYRHRKTN